MSGIWVLITVAHVATIAFGASIWIFYKKNKDIL
jgi:hypothetical protein